jgi:hypothetical protein
MFLILSCPCSYGLLRVYSVLQCVVVVLQNVFGGSFFWPSRMRKHVFDYSERGFGMAQMMCAVCLNEIRQSAMVTQCGHAFHAKCLLRWMQEEMVCPVCREQLLEPSHPEQYHRDIYNNEDI